MLFLKYKNFQNPPLLGTPNSVQLSLPVVSNAASLTGSACNFSSLSAPAISSAWLLPTASGTSFQPLMVMETSLGLQPSSQTFRLPQTSTPKSYKNRNIQILESNPPPEFGEISMIAPVQSSNNLLALPSAPSQEQKENNTFDIKIKLSKSLDAYQIPIENQDPPLLPLEIPDIHQLLACIDPLGQGEQPGFENTDLGKNSLSLQDQGTLEKNGIESSGGLADISMVEDFHLPQLFNSLSDLDQSKGPEVIKTPSDQVRKHKRKASEPVSSAPKAKIQSKNPGCPLEEEVVICNTTTSDRAPVNTAKHSSNSKPKKVASSRIGKTKSHGQEKSRKTRENNSKKTEESKQSGNRVKAEEKPIIPKMKRKKNQPELSQETFIKPRSCLGMHMLESVFGLP
uniref:Chromosome 2 open reading frame 78 n=1 Tax=Rhinolophus ferrumequinum TaxID=59479 RepID=A0A671EVT9_RHIFE